MSTPVSEDAAVDMSHYLILVVEESASSLGLYDSATGKEVGRVRLSLWPHEIAVSRDGRAYVSNFGVRDYDLTLGFAGNSVSVIDIAGRCEVGRFFTRHGDAKYWAPHGVKLSPDERYLYVNVERVVGVRDPDLTRPGSEFTKLLQFDRSTGDVLRVLEVPIPSYEPLAAIPSRFSDATATYDVLPGTHNFVFSPIAPNELWLFSGRSGVSVMDLNSGEIVARLTDFAGAVRALAFGSSGKTLLVSATNELALVDASTRRIAKRFGNLGVGQILYSKLTPDEKHIIAPAVWEGLVLIVEVATGRVQHRLSTGVDPVQVVISPDDARAYVTHGRSEWLSYIELSDLGRIAGRVKTRGGPNGAAFAPWSSVPINRTLVLGACLPFTGLYSAEGRELRLGYQFWQDTVNDAGGVMISGHPHSIEIAYIDSGSATEETTLTAVVASLVNAESPALILGGYPSVADRWVGNAATQTGLPFISPLGRDPALFGAGYPRVMGLAADDECELEGVLRAVRHGVSPRPRAVAVLVADLPQYLDEGLATVRSAVRLGFQPVVVNGDPAQPVKYPTKADPTTVLAAVSELVPDLVLVVGGREDSLAVLRSCDALRFTPGGIALSCGITSPGFKEKAGRLGDGLLGGVQWTDSVFHYAEDRFGAGVDYSRLYFDEFSEPASVFAAAASAVGVLIERAISAGATSGASIADTARTLRFESFFGPIGFGVNGRNDAKATYAVQLVADGAERLREVPLWPREVARARPQWPRG